MERSIETPLHQYEQEKFRKTLGGCYSEGDDDDLVRLVAFFGTMYHICHLAPLLLPVNIP